MAFDTGEIVTAARRPPSILLAKQAYVVASRNDTTAAAKSRCERTVEVTFWLADPPAVSFCSVHCFKDAKSEDADLEVNPYVLAAEGPYVLLCTRFASGDGEYEYLMYKGDVKSPSLECIPLPEDWAMLDGVNEFGILPLGEEYLIVGWYDNVFTLDMALRIYSSEDRTWRTERMPNPCPRGDMIIPEKVITLGEGVLGMVDFWKGMLVFDLLQKPVVARYIPLPDPLPENVRRLQVFNPGLSPARYRDLTCSNGVIKFIEMEHRVITQESREIAPEKPEDPTQKGVLYDSELIRPRQKPIGVVSKPKKVYSMNGWRAVTWTREMDSDCWRIAGTIDVDDILVDNSFAEVLSSQSIETLRNLSFKKMNSGWPILSPDGDDLLYLKVTPELRGLDRWTVAVDLAEKKLKVEARGVETRSLGRYIPSWRMYQSCALSKHLNMTPGIKVQGFCEITLPGTFANDPNTTAVHVAEPNSFETVNKRPRLSAEKVNLAQHDAQSVMQNSHTLGLSEPDSYETENKRQRLSAEKVNLTQNGSQSFVQNAHILSLSGSDSCEIESSRPRLSAEKVNLAQNAAQSSAQNAHISAHPDQNSKPPEMFFYPGYSWWPHENNLHVPFHLPQQYFNRWGGSSVPGYAPSAPAPNLSYGNYYPFNYQPEWWQPPPSMQQYAPIRAVGPHEATRPRFNNWYGASNHGYSQQQLPAHNLNAYGSRSDNGNYQPQSQPCPPIQLLPAYAALQQPLVPLQHPLTGSGVWIP